MKRSVYCLAKDESQAGHIVDDLHAAHFGDSLISVLCQDKKLQSSITGSSKEGFATKTGSDIGFQKTSRYSEGASTGAVTGGAIGGALGLLAGLGAITIPGIGPLLAAGPIMSALAGTGAGGAVGFLTGGVTGSAIPDYEVSKVKSGLKEGRIFISVDTDSSEEENAVKSVFEKNGASGISASSELTPGSP